MANAQAKPRRHKADQSERIRRDAELFLGKARESDSKRGAVTAVMVMLAGLKPKEADDLINFLLASCGEAFHPIGRPVGNIVRTLLHRNANRPGSATEFLTKWATSRIGKLEGKLNHGRSFDDEVTAKLNAVADLAKREGISENAACERLIQEHKGEPGWSYFDAHWYRKTKSNRKRSPSRRS